MNAGMREPMEHLLEQILYELRLANWYTCGAKGEPPAPPGYQAVRVDGKWLYFDEQKLDVKPLPENA